jgi:hypothetical protein
MAETGLRLDRPVSTDHQQSLFGLAELGTAAQALVGVRVGGADASSHGEVPQHWSRVCDGRPRERGKLRESSGQARVRKLPPSVAITTRC